MSHLTLESLARLVDEAPDAQERAHLEGCADCREELDALREQTGALSLLPELMPPPHAWEEVERRLVGEGLLHVRRPAPRLPAPGLLRLAASVALFALGGVVGAWLTGRADAPAAPPAAAAADPASGDARFAGGVLDGDPAVAVRQAEAAYLRALAGYAESYGPIQGSDPVARLAALESIVLTTRAALERAPADPVINGYHLTAVAQREAMLQQLVASPDTTWF